MTAQAMSEDLCSRGKAQRLGLVEGQQSRENEIIYHPPNGGQCSGCVVYFGGDIQDYKENMLAHRDNQRYADKDLESTAVLLNKHFPDSAIFIVKPSKMTLKTFSCFQNFVTVNDYGAPTYETRNDGLRHLHLLLKNASKRTPFNSCCESIAVVGFSKGCVVLNQLLYSFHSLAGDQDPDLVAFVGAIKDLYWLEGGHSGSSSTWVTDKAVLQSFADLKKNVHIHVTPYQVKCDTRPRIGKEEKLFHGILCRLKVNVERKMHFESLPRSLESHFNVLEVFRQ